MEEQFKQDVERIAGDFFSLHSLMTDGLMGNWTGQAFEAHLEMEKRLFTKLTDILVNCETFLNPSHDRNEHWRE